MSLKGTSPRNSIPAITILATQKKMKSGVYKATVTVNDPTVWVQQTDRTSLSQAHTWTVRVSE